VTVTHGSDAASDGDAGDQGAGDHGTGDHGTGDHGVGLGRRAVVNSAKLGAAMLASWVLAFAGRLLLPTLLSADDFGRLTFIESATIMVMSFVAFGADTYIRREVSARPEHARDFGRPLTIIRLVAGSLVAGVFGLVFGVIAGSGKEAVIAALFALGQVALTIGQTNAAFLQAAHNVNWVTIMTVAAKVLWFVLLVGLLAPGAGMLALPIAFAVSETARALQLRRAVRAEYGSWPKQPLANAFTVIRKSVPFYIDAINLTFTMYNFPIILGLLSGDADEAGYYGLASLILSVPMMFAPLFSWVGIPVLARLHAVDRDLMWRRVTMIVDTLLVVFFAGGVFILLGADLVMAVFGDKYDPAVPALAMLAFSLPATFLATVLGGAYVTDGRGWQNTRVNVVTMVGMTVAAIVTTAVAGDTIEGRAAWLTAAVVVVGEWITVAWLFLMRGIHRLSAVTLARLGVLVAAAALGGVDRIANGSVGTLSLVAAVLTVAMTVWALPGVLRTGKVLVGRADD
jgi:O-antigen/teichoic acid export membrane protein